MIINHLDNLNNCDGTRIDFTYVANISLNLFIQRNTIKSCYLASSKNNIRGFFHSFNLQLSSPNLNNIFLVDS